MKSNAELDFEISAEDMEILKNFEKIKSYGHGKHDKNPRHILKVMKPWRELRLKFYGTA